MFPVKNEMRCSSVTDIPIISTFDSSYHILEILNKYHDCASSNAQRYVLDCDHLLLLRRLLSILNENCKHLKIYKDEKQPEDSKESRENLCDVIKGIINTIFIPCLDEIFRTDEIKENRSNICLSGDDGNREDIFSLLCDVTILSLKVLGIISPDVFNTIFKAVMQNLANIVSEAEKLDICHSVNIFKEVLDFLSALLNCLCKSNHYNNTFDDLLISFSSILHHCSSNTAAFIMIYIIPKIICLVKSDLKVSILKDVWMLISSLFHEDINGMTCEKDQNAYIILCCFCDYILSEDCLITNLQFSVYCDGKFWKIIQYGLVHNNSLIRKKSLYLLQLFIMWTKNKDCCILISDDIPIFEKKDSFTSDLKNIWEDMIAVLEVLEEKQVHVIKPVLHKVEKFIQLSYKSDNELFCLHTSWLVVLFQRLLNHENKYIKKWCISCILDLKMSQCPVLEQDSAKLFTSTLFQALNDPALYVRVQHSTAGNITISWENIFKFLTSCDCSFESTIKKAEFFTTVLHDICSQSWGGVALLYVSCALAHVQNVPSWKKSDLPLIREVVCNSQRTQEPLLRGAIQCYLMKAVLHLLDCNNITFEDLSRFFVVFKETESLIRGSAQWTEIASWLQICFSSQMSKTLSLESATEFCFACVNEVLQPLDTQDVQEIQSCKMRRMARMIMILADASIICPRSCCKTKCYCEKDQCLQWTCLLSSLSHILISAPSRPYLSDQRFQQALQFLLCIIKESKGFGKGIINDEHRKDIISCLLNSADTIHFIFHQLFANFDSIQDISRLKLFIEALYILSDEKEIRSILINLLPSFVENCFTVFEKDLNEKVLQLWRALAWICHLLLNENFEITVLNNTLHNILFLLIEKKLLAISFAKPEFISDNITKVEWIKLANEATSDVWNCAAYYFTRSLDTIDDSLAINITQQAIQALSTGPKNAVQHIFQSMKLLLPQVSKCDTDLLLDFFDAGWKTCLELRRSDMFRPAVKVYIQMAYQSCIMTSLSFPFFNKHIICIKELGESSVGLFNILIDHCCDNLKTETKLLGFDFTTLLVDALVFGPVHRKDQKVIETASAFIIKQGDNLSVNNVIQSDHQSDVLVRVQAINFLRTLSPEKLENQYMAASIVEKLIEIDMNVTSTRSRHFGNSYIHRVKNRIWQAILLLQPFLMEPSNNRLVKKVFELLEENQQPSVRYLLEWIAVKILHSHHDLFKDLITITEKAGEKHSGSTVSLLSILIHLSPHVNNLENMMMIWLPYTLPFCMMQNFNIRIYAHVALLKLWEICESRNLSKVMEKFELVKICIKSLHSSKGYGNASKNSQKLAEDFYFSVFDPIEHYTLQTIFYELPRLTCLTEEEWIHPSLFVTCNQIKNPISLYNKDSKLEGFQPSSWTFKISTDSDIVDDTEVSNFQKKITPWKQIIPDLEKLGNMQVKRKPRVKDGLVVVASLIDRTPNLGGLCRTCEVFRVSEYVIGKMQVIHDKQFQNLSVTADKWISIKEVPVHHLREYMKFMRHKGYTLIGAEQTEDSELLTNYVFPQKSLILLGNEKTGLPIDLIHLLDVCVEIPQQGVIRSLNVHVSGAILIWEYARQHTLYNI